MALGILGGSFDPIHLGHLLIAQEAAEELSLEQVLFIPAGKAWLKGREISPAYHRLEMVRLAVSGNPAFDISTIEIEREGPSYTVDTLLSLRQKVPELFLLIGWDSLIELPKWYRPDWLVQLCHLVAVPRHGIPTPDLAGLEREIPGISGRLRMLSWPVIDISSSMVRERVKRGRSIRYMVPEQVEKYICERGLYR